jgi:hypothetical protein
MADETPDITERRTVPRRSGLAVVAAVVVIAAVATAVPFRGSRAAGPTTPAPSSPAPSAAVRAAMAGPWLLIDQPGWVIADVYGFSGADGSITFRQGERAVEMNWYAAEYYDSYYADRLPLSRPEPVKVDGWAGNLFRYSAHDFAVMLKPRDGAFVELRADGDLTRRTLDGILADTVLVDERTWLAAIPQDIVTPGRVEESAKKVLADVPLPPGFDISALDIDGTNAPYFFGVIVIGHVGCAWITEWLRAKETGDDAALDRAEAALKNSHRWKVLREMARDGDWPHSFWQVTDGVIDNDPPADYRHRLGCI